MAKRNLEEELDVGARLKAVRLSKRLSQRELARISGVTNGLISQIEQRHSSPSISSLKRILDAIPMTLSDFFADENIDRRQIFFRKDELRELNPAKVFPQSQDAADTVSLRQVGYRSHHKIQMLHEHYAPGADTGSDPYTHDAEEAGIIVSGQIELTVGDKTQTLVAGDAYIFDSTIPHRFRNNGVEECVIISACTPPSF